MEKTQGNFLSQIGADFPVDCETLDYLQTNIDMAAIIGNLVGDKTILRGCEKNGDTWRAGYVFLRTRDFPDGEVLRFEGGNASVGVYIKQEDVAVTTQGEKYPRAYSRRSLVCGSGGENYAWRDFVAPRVRLQDSDHRFITDAERTAWNGKETPTGAQDKADNALTEANDYTDERETAIRTDIVDSAPAKLNTLRKLAAAITAPSMAPCFISPTEEFSVLEHQLDPRFPKDINITDLLFFDEAAGCWLSKTLNIDDENASGAFSIECYLSAEQLADLPAIVPIEVVGGGDLSAGCSISVRSSSPHSVERSNSFNVYGQGGRVGLILAKTGSGYILLGGHEHYPN